MAVRTISNIGGDYNDIVAWVEGIVPIDGDDIVAQLNGASGNLVININTAVFNSFDLTGYTGILSGHYNITITPISLSVVVLFAGTISWHGLLTLIIPSFKTINLTMGTRNIGTTSIRSNTINGGTLSLQGDVVMGSSSSDEFTDLAYITFNTNGYNITCGRFRNYRGGLILNLEDSIINLNANNTQWQMDDAKVILNAGTSIINISYNEVYFQGGGLSYYDVNFINNGDGKITGNNYFNNLSIVSIEGYSSSVLIGGNQTIGGILTLNGYNSTDSRLLIRSDIIGTPRTLYIGHIVILNTDFQNILVGIFGGPFPGRNSVYVIE